MLRREFLGNSLSFLGFGPVLLTVKSAAEEAVVVTGASSDVASPSIDLVELSKLIGPALVDFETGEVLFSSKKGFCLLREGWEGTNNDVFWQKDKWVWASRHTAVMSLTVLRVRDLQLEADVFPRPYAQLPPQETSVYWNGGFLGTVKFDKAKGYQQVHFSFKVPSVLVHQGENKLTFDSLYAISPLEVEKQGDPRAVSVAVKSVKLSEPAVAAELPSLRIDGDSFAHNALSCVRLSGRIPAEGDVLLKCILEGKGRIVLCTDENYFVGEDLHVGSGPAHDAEIDLSRWRGETIQIRLLNTEAPPAKVSWKGLKFTCCRERAVAPKAAPRKPDGVKNVVVVILDALRAAEVGCYGYYRQTTPFLDQFAAGGMKFSDMRSAYTWTLPSSLSLLTSLHPFEHNMVAHDGEVFSSPELLAQNCLKGHGIKCGAAIQNPYLSTGRGITAGFEKRQEHFSTSSFTEGGCKAVTASAVEMARAFKNERFFLYLHYLPPHAPYGMSEQFRGRISCAPRDDVPLDANWTRKIKKEEMAPGSIKNEKIRAAYDENVMLADLVLRNLVEVLRAEGFGSETLLIVTADHGEEFFEHGQGGHCGAPHEVQSHVPLVMNTVAGNLGACETNLPVGTVDLAPTVFDLFSLPQPAHFSGTSIFAQPEDGRVIYSCGGIPLDWRLQCRREAFVIDGYKLVASILSECWDEAHQNPYAEVYDLQADPEEQHDLAHSRPVLRDYLYARAQLWKATQLKLNKRAVVKPIGAKEAAPEVTEAIKALGYL